jgi:poly-beta-1,6-N-acetyl-D-glucosamine synthase
MRWIFLSAIAVIAYTYFGYPALLWLRSRLHARPVSRAPLFPSISIILVVRNEAHRLAAKLQNLTQLNYPSDRTEIVVVSDGSTDETNSILAQFALSPARRVIVNQQSRGKASCLNEATGVAAGDIVIFTDARQEIEFDAIRLLLENFTDPNVGCASGELLLGDRHSGESDKGMSTYWKVEKRIRDMEAISGSVIGATGALYAVRRNLLVTLPPQTILDDVYIPMQVLRKGFRVVFDSRARVWDIPDQGIRREFSRKVRTLSGNYQLLELAPWLLSSANPARLRFVSHKLMRLLVPFALLALLVTSALDSGAFFRMALAAQLGFYGFSVCALALPKHSPLTRLADAALTFVLLNTAAIVAFANFVTGRKVAWVR